MPRGSKITALHYRALWTLYGESGYATPDRIGYLLRIDPRHALKLLSDMTRARFCGPLGAWVCRAQKPPLRFAVSGRRGSGDEECTGGFRAMENSRSMPELAPHLERVWREEALCGMRADGEETKIKNAVVWR